MRSGFDSRHPDKMKSVGGFLKRFKHLQAPERTVREALVQAADELVGIKMKSEWIKIAGESVVYIQAPSAVKTVLFEEKLSILSRANSILGKEQLRELR